uniref:Sod_Cu domain-containing protein n=1 Tax=Schistocephalus solidus TaxID=70667 RepID=A0A183SQE5_SCHSO
LGRCSVFCLHFKDETKRAKAVFEGPYAGEFTLTQLSKGILINGCLRGFPPNGKHGFHVHEFGRLGNSCQDAGAHYNPLDMHHGGIQTPVRHIGDLGNLQSDANGVVCTNLHYPETDLTGKYSVLGRALVIHEMEDDLGTAGTADSQATGSSGKRLTCAVINPV